MIETKESLIGSISSKESLSGSLNMGVEKVYPALQEKEVTPSGEIQEIVADEGIYGLSKVTVDKVNLQDKTVTPSAQEQIVNADEEYTGLNNVIVNPTPTQEKTATPTKDTQEIIPDEGKFLDKVVINGDKNLSPENIVMGKTIFGTTGEAETAERWNPEPDWWDIKSIIENDNTINPDTGEPYKGKAIILISDFEDTTSINKLSTFSDYKVYAIKTSDGVEYRNNDWETHTWDKTKDKPCSKGYKTRYLIFYTDEDWVHEYSYSFLPFSVKGDLYHIYDCNIISNASLSMQSITVQCIEFINDKKIILNSDINFSSNYSIIEYRFDLELQKDISYTGVFTNNFWCKKHPNIINSHHIKNFSSWFSSNNAVEKIQYINLSNANASNALYNSFYMCMNLKKLNLSLPSDYISYQDFLKQVRVSEFKSDSVIKATSLYNAFYQTQITVFDVEIDSSKCTNFGYFFAFNYVLETIISELDFASCTKTSQMFYGCSRLKNVKIKNLSTDLNLSQNNYLSQDSIDYLVEHIVDLTGQTSKTLNLGPTNKAKLSNEQLEKLSNYNWSVS